MLPEQLNNLKNRHRYEVDSEGNIIIYKYDGEKFVRLFDLDELGDIQILVSYQGYSPVESLDDEIDLHPSYHSALVYYVRAKCFLEEGDIEKHEYYMNLFDNTLRRRIVAKRDIQVEASDYSLL